MAGMGGDIENVVSAHTDALLLGREYFNRIYIAYIQPTRSICAIDSSRFVSAYCWCSPQYACIFYSRRMTVLLRIVCFECNPDIESTVVFPSHRLSSFTLCTINTSCVNHYPKYQRTENVI